MFSLQDAGYQHGKTVFKSWVKGDFKENMARKVRHKEISSLHLTCTKIPACVSHICARRLLLLLFTLLLFTLLLSNQQSQRGFTDLSERISRIDQPIFSSQFDWEPSSYADGVFGLDAPDSRVLLSEDEDDERLIRYRPRTGSLSEHEDLLALKAQARAIQQLEERNTPLSGDEAGYDVSTAGSTLPVLM